MRPQNKSKLSALLRSFIAGEIDTSEFCDAYERAYNFEIDRTHLTPSDAAAFKRLFEEVVYYSPYPDDRARVPNYRSEAQIKAAATAAATIVMN